MIRALLALVGSYGFKLSLAATRNIVEIAERARAGDVEARSHFTQTRYARVFGVRNSDLGMVYYGAVALAALTGVIRRPLVLRALLGAAILSMAASVYLLWALFFRLRECVRCA